MDQAPYLIFSLHDSLYAVHAHGVREILWLPELAPIAEAPGYMVGVINLRGKIVPVMDLDLRLGKRPRRYCLTDNVIVLEREGLLLGIIVNEVHEVQSISREETEAAPAYGPIGESRPRLVASAARVEGNIIGLLNLATLRGYAEEMDGLSTDGISTLPSSHPAFLPEATPEEKAVFHERAQNLRRPTDGQDLAGLMPMAVVGLGGEYFGVDLAVVREFAEVHGVTPVPCCPEHIVGSMNLRGDIITLIDIRGVLQVPVVGNPSAGKVVVVPKGELLTGVLVDEVFEVIYLHPRDLTAVPAAVQSASEAYLRGAAPYHKKVLSILDLAKILANESLVVNEEVRVEL